MAEWAKRQRLDWMLARAKKMGALKLFVGGGAPFPDLSPGKRERLRRMFLPEIEALEATMNRDFSSWKSESITPILTPQGSKRGMRDVAAA